MTALGGRGQGFERAIALVAAYGFGFGVGVATITLPLLALDVGYDFRTIGLLTSASAISQLGTRLLLPDLLTRQPDRTLMALATAAVASGFGLLLVSTALPVFVVTQLLLGLGRALFWTGIQTHVVRIGLPHVRALANVQIVGNLGLLSGPLLAGILATASLYIPVAVAAATSGVATLAALLLVRLPPYEREQRSSGRRVWQQPGVDLACWASWAGGGWRAMLGSYVPVILASSGTGPELIGYLIAAADGIGILATASLVRLASGRLPAAAQLASATMAAGLVVFALWPGHVAVQAVALVVAGIGGGSLTTIGPAIASGQSRPQDQGTAIAVTGTFRAGAILSSPLAVALALPVVGLPIATAAVSVGMGLPAVVVGRYRAARRHRNGTEATDDADG